MKIELMCRYAGDYDSAAWLYSQFMTHWDDPGATVVVFRDDYVLRPGQCADWLGCGLGTLLALPCHLRSHLHNVVAFLLAFDS